MSWSFLLVYGLGAVNGLILKDPKSVEQMELMASGAGMMTANNAMQPKNYP